MSYLSQVIKETMRIVTTSSAVTRVSSQDYTLSNGVTIPKGTDIYCHLWASHHNSSFPDAYEFKPERFADGDGEWCPFFVGTRQCKPLNIIYNCLTNDFLLGIGMNFSLLELKVNLVLILQQFELSMSEGNPDYKKLRLNSMNVIKPLDLKLKFKNIL
jgi:cytochrome P450